MTTVAVRGHSEHVVELSIVRLCAGVFCAPCFLVSIWFSNLFCCKYLNTWTWIVIIQEYTLLVEAPYGNESFCIFECRLIEKYSMRTLSVS